MLLEYCRARDSTRFRILTAGLAFGGSGQCSCRVGCFRKQLCKAFNYKILYGHYTDNVLYLPQSPLLADSHVFKTANNFCDQAQDNT